MTGETQQPFINQEAADRLEATDASYTVQLWELSEVLGHAYLIGDKELIDATWADIHSVRLAALEEAERRSA